MIHANDTLEGVRSLWDDEPKLAELVPGGLTLGRVHQDAKAPYASVKIKAQEPQYNSGREYVQSWDVTITVWSSRGAVNSGSIQDLLDIVYDRDAIDRLLIRRATKVLDMVRKTADVEEDQSRREQEDVLMATVAIEIIVQATR